MRFNPTSTAELSEALVTASGGRHRISLGGAFSKQRMGGASAPADVVISTARMTRVLQYEPRDLTISVEAGLLYSELTRLLDQQGQMVPLDAAYAETATVGGILGVNGSGPRRRAYGTARDFTIGMQFCTLAGRTVQSGGMVVKNVAGLDMAKLMIGSFGTLAAIAVVNFKVFPKPEVERTCVLQFEALEAACAARDALIRGVLQPSAVDLINPLAALRMGFKGFLLAVQYSGNEAVCLRYERELRGMVLAASEQLKFWRAVQGYGAWFVEKFAEGAVVRVSSKIGEVGAILASVEDAALSRAANGVTHVYFPRLDSALKWMANNRVGRAVMETGPEQGRETLQMWPHPGSDFAMMARVKNMFDPLGLLNKGRLYNRI